MLTLLLAWSLAASPAAEVEQLLTQHGFGVVVRAPELDRVALALVRRHGPTGNETGASAAKLKFFLEAEGVADAHVRPFTLRHATLRAFQVALPKALGVLERQRPPTHFGLATYLRTDGERITTLILVHRGLVLDTALPQVAAVNQVLATAGHLRRGYYSPRLLVSTPRGRLRERPLRSVDRALDIVVHFNEGPGVYRVEVVAEGQRGPVVLVNHRVHVGVSPPSLPVVKLAPEVEDAAKPARALAKAINAQRTARGLGALHWHEGLAEVAQGHADEMAKQGALMHAPPSGGPLTLRLRAQGFKAGRVAENIARADSPAAALGAFLESPGHKRNLLLGEPTHMGVGYEAGYYSVAIVELDERAQQVAPQMNERDEAAATAGRLRRPAQP